MKQWWTAFLLALGAYAVVGSVLLVWVPDLAGVFLLGAYCIPANSVFPIPHEPAVLYFARYYDPVWMATAATVGSIIASFADYALVGAAMQHRALANARNSRLFRWAVRWMKRWPFAIIVLFSFAPLPISIIRILAPAAEYPIARYVVAQIVGRFPRFFLLAWIGHTFTIPSWVLLGMFATLLVSVIVSMRGGPDASTEELEDEAPVADPV